MPQNKRILFSSRQQQVANKAQAMCHPARLEILELLRKHDFMVCGDFVELIPLEQGTISHHLEVLLEAQLIIRDELIGEIGYRINHIGWQQARMSIEHFFAKIGWALERLDEEVMPLNEKNR